jgi:L-ascorbate metabolism protein UlaG (beta-lactamase superfamily)
MIYLFDIKKAAELVNAICPDVAIPTHYGSIVGKPEDGEVFERYVKETTRVEFRMRF